MCGKPLVVWSIEKGRLSKYVDTLLVTTDCPQIASIAKKAGAYVPFLRPPELALDQTTTYETLRHTIELLKEKDGMFLVAQAVGNQMVAQGGGGSIIQMSSIYGLLAPDQRIYEGSIPFELNARFSGTTAVRAYFGFNEPEMAIINFFHKMEVKQPKVRKGVAMRYHEEVFIENTDSNELIVGVEQGSFIPWF